MAPSKEPKIFNERCQAADEMAGFTVSWEENDQMNPIYISKFRRWLITMIVLFGSLCVSCTSSMYSTTYDQLIKDFDCICPLFLSPLSEFYGRRYIYIVSFTFFVIWLIPCAVAKNIQTMIISRFFNGLAGSAFLSVAGGTVGDLFDRHELALPMMLYTATPFIGPEIGPLVGGFINQYTTWRWTFYVLLIWAGVMLVSIIFLIPETYHPVLLKHKAEKLRQETGDDRWKAPIEKSQKSVKQTVLQSMYRPILLLTIEQMCLSLCVISAILLGILYLFFGAFQLISSNVYSFSTSQCGLCFLGLLVGMALTIITDPFWPILGGPLVTTGLFIFAWTIYADVHWIVPIIGSAVFGAGTILVYSGIFTFLVDAYPLFAASALAANSFTRSTFSGIFPLFGIQMKARLALTSGILYDKLGYHWAISLLAFLTLVMAPFPYIFFRYGSQIRGKSRFADL
ncbi:MFS general substrate transporter [Aspergillus eucalypticola CBS 122712]|uniref:MFS general substrate transporter n=1 Tax=Aspergillus eucalypticola (strain CBS 122712 / IBT 29274) TaxID=1448314 RepID=A0A317UTM0_ASPEC|nr:MFS general substrate transporter [Aspergillus eucalypticola CBS 122712]PWY65384.1 MFS general substrate transporter [Aspergillus eucalypticola CBS 122712]